MQELPVIVGVGGVASEVGKTTLICDLLQGLPGWEAIKTTRGHYRSCGKDPHACCVSDLIGEAAVIRSGRELTYEAGKDTGRYWDAGATNVHWLIATDEQVREGIIEALKRVRSPGVLIEGNSFASYVKPDLMIMVVGGKSVVIKRTARTALPLCSALYSPSALEDYDFLSRMRAATSASNSLPFLTKPDLPYLLHRIQALLADRCYNIEPADC